jgi:LacI family transcriptional regulator
VIADSANPFFVKIVKGVEATLHQHGYNLILCNTNEDYAREKSAIDLLSDQGTDGIILTPAQSRDEDIAFLLSKKIPFVLLGRHFSSYNVPCVISSDKDGAYKAVDHLLRLGHRRILFLNAYKHISSAEERLDGYGAAYRENDVEMDPELVRYCEPKMEGAYNELKSVFLEGLKFSAVFTFSDLMMLGVVRLLHEKGLQIPQHISLIGFDDIDFVSLLTPPLTTVFQDTHRLGVESASLLLRMINGQQTGGVTRIVPTKLVIRGSTAKL